ncbi:SusC/RagA family TonB-linked outer membrane protein [Pedobacter sp. MC2016-14]|uniref:SusC/RagA family TonB-linked outer membrane protein n=1 Tax=Pedobacter sp. MC2016-14 TaxID=2897327 RepID=UPI001E483760|nr:SusC/RagA family TonB-linked outer membrane protein [Pedobacter sp. MC2016-14]MCD0488613.1 SusC/RagA family TonB-linked outer membrane protein [Pedobacter sp. MC2016-14]
MRLTTIIILASLLQVSAVTFGQKITIDQKNVPLTSLFKEIRKQSGYNFYYDGSIIKPGILGSVIVSDASIEEALKSMLADLPFKYEIKDRTVLITKKEDPSFLTNFMNRLSEIDISGKIVDAETGNPLPGATVRIKGTRNFANTQTNGEFNLDNVKENAILVISYIGYKTKEVPVSANPGVIRLEADLATLDEVGVTVNTGYQRISPQQVTGAISQIGTKAFESRISTDLLSGLQNRLPGLLINNDIQFQGNNLFQIRGISTMTGNPKPLIVLDGYPTDLSLNDINPNEIENATILRDAATAAIYGVRASNGVIIIDRKKGVAGDARIAFRSTLSLRPHDNYSKFRYEKDGSIQLNYFRSRGYGTSLPGYITSEETGAQPYLTGYSSDAAVNLLIDQSLGRITAAQAEQGYADLASYNNAEDYEKYFLRNAVTQQYNLNVSGGSNKALYYITGNYLGNKLNQQNNDNRKVQLSSRFNLTLSKRLSVELLTDYNETIANSAPIPDISKIYADERFADANGNPLPIVAGSSRAGSRLTAATLLKGFVDQRMYPLTEMNEVNTRQRIADYRVSANFKYNIGKGLDLSFGGVYESSTTQQRRIGTENSSMTRTIFNRFIQPVTTTNALLTYNLPRGGYLQEQESLLRSYTTRAQLNYNKQISSDHSINAILGAEVRKGVTEGSRAATFGYNDQTLLQQPTDYNKLFNSSTSFNTNYIYNSQGVPLVYTDLFAQTFSDDRFVSGYMNAVYSYKSRYSMTGSIRIDQSNLFGTDPKYKYKPLWSLGAAWNIDRENFMKEVTWVDALKLRMARGFNGNISKASLPQVVAQYALNDVTLPSYSSLTLLTPANSGLRWEQTDNFNLGLDFTIFRNISGSMDYYRKKSTDVLGNLDIDPFKGVTPALVNLASISNKGIEFTLNSDWLKRGKLNWNSGWVVSYNTSKVLEAYIPQASIPQFSSQALPTVSSQAVITAAAGGYMKGEPVGNIYSYRYAGINAAGAALYYDSKGNPTVITSTIDEGYGSLDSRGTSIPALNMGLSNRLDIGNFYLYAMVNYYGGFVVRTPLPSPIVPRPIEGAGSYWKKAGDEATASLPSAAYINTSGAAYLANSDRFVMNGAYLTVGDVTLSYNLRDLAPLKKAGFSNFEVKLQASNIYTVGFNPDNYSLATGSYLKKYITPTYTLGIFTNF